MPQRGKEFVRFLLVGGLAFLVDSLLFFVLVALKIEVVVARVVSIAVAMQVAYALNATFTYRHSQGICVATWRKYLLSNALGAVINYGVFMGVLYVPLTLEPVLWHQGAIACGTGVALVFNHWANKRFAFRRKPSGG